MLRVKDIMTQPVFSLTETDSLYSARSLMDLQRIRHIPIASAEGDFIGLVTHRDILSATISQLADVTADEQREIDAGIPIREIMRTDITTVAEDTPLREAAQTLLNHKYGCLPVVRNSQLTAIVTEADFLRLTINLMDALDNA